MDVNAAAGGAEKRLRAETRAAVLDDEGSS